MIASERVPVENRLQGLCSSYEVIRNAAQNRPEKTAFYYLKQGTAEEEAINISYGDLFARVTQTANLFHDLGVGTRDVISYILPNLPQTHYVLWGGAAAGIVNPINPMLDTDHIVGIMTAAKSKILVVHMPDDDGEYGQKLEDIKTRVPTLTHIIQVKSGPTDDLPDDMVYYETVIDQYNADQLDSGRVFHGDDICSLFHTGGTTGTPKMARHSHYNEVVNAMMVTLAMDMTSDDVGLCGLPLFHVNAAIITGLACFFKAASVVLATPAGYRTPELIADFWKIVEKYRVTFFSGVPTIYSSLLQVPVATSDVSSLRMAICGAAPMPREVIRKFEAATGLAPLEGYGMTEGVCVSSCNPLGGERRVGSVGFRLPYQEMKTVILDQDNGYLRDCMVDEIGNVVIRGPSVFGGYLQDSDNDGVWLEGGWFNSGDMGREDEQGYFWLTGRTKELIIRGGHNIDPAVIENALSLHQDILAVAAVGKPDSYAGEVPVAYVVLKSDRKVNSADLIEFSRSHIAERAAVPKEIYLIDRLPLTAVGKIYKPALKEDAMKRATMDALKDFDPDSNKGLKISVAADRTYGTVAVIEIDSSVPDGDIDRIRQIMAQFGFHTIIK